MNRMTNKLCDSDQTYIQDYVKNYTVKPVANKIDLYLIDEIDSVDRFAAWLPLIQDATEYDEIIVHISSPGGLLDVSLQIYESLRLSPAHVEISIEGPCCSGASMIMMAADSMSITPASYVMCHAFKGGFIGKANEIFSNSEFSKPWFKRVVMDVYKDFMTESEIERMLNGEDFYFTAEEVSDRFNKVLTARQKMQAARDKLSKKIEKDVSDFFAKNDVFNEDEKSKKTNKKDIKEKETKEIKEKETKAVKKPVKKPSKKEDEKTE